MLILDFSTPTDWSSGFTCIDSYLFESEFSVCYTIDSEDLVGAAIL